MAIDRGAPIHGTGWTIGDIVDAVTEGGDGGGSYTLPVATDTVLGGVKQGSGVTVAGDGTLSAASFIEGTDGSGNPLLSLVGAAGIDGGVQGGQWVKITGGTGPAVGGDGWGGGRLMLASGDAGAAGGAGGRFTIDAGYTPSGHGGNILVSSGRSDDGDGGYIRMTAGAGAGGVGGNVQLAAGQSDRGTQGGDVRFTSGSSVNGDGRGGDVQFILGSGVGTGRAGQLVVEVPTSDPTVSNAIWSDNGVLVQSGHTASGVFIPPTSDPHVAGALWNNAGTLAISAG